MVMPIIVTLLVNNNKLFLVLNILTIAYIAP